VPYGTLHFLRAASVVVDTSEELAPIANVMEADTPGCHRRAEKLDQYRASLDAGADPVSVARWITETEAERAMPTQARPSMNRERSPL
jgi:hypothetical protein